MKKILPLTLVLSLIISVALPYTTAYAKTRTATSDETSVKPLGNSTTTLNYTNSVGYYLAQDIPQGLEFTILGEGDFILAKDTVNGNYYLVEGTNDLSQVDSALGNRLSLVVSPRAGASSYENPSTPISKNIGNRTLWGVWWGGILDDVGIVSSVAAVTIATTDRTQSKASVRPGATASWQSSEWKNTGIKATVMKSVGIAGNEAKWDLQAN